MLGVVDNLLDYIFTQGNNRNHKHLLIGLFPGIARLGEKVDSYHQFFVSEKNMDGPHTSFSQRLTAPEFSH